MITHAPVLGGSTDYSCLIRVIDSTDGTPETGFDHATSGIDLWYRRGARGAVTSITEAALAAVDSAHSDGGVEQVGNGYVRVDLPDAAVAAGVECVQVGGTATGMVVIGALIPIVNTTTAMLGVNVVSFTANALTAAAINADALTAAKVAADVGTEIGTAVWATAARTLTANTNLNDPTAAAIADAVWDEAQADHVGAGSFGLVASEVADILVDTAEIGAAGAGLTAINLPDQTMNITGNITGNLSGSVGSVTGAVGSVTGAVGSVTGAVGSVTGAVGSVTDGVNVTKINSVTLTGDGSVTPWGPA